MKEKFPKYPIKGFSIYDLNAYGKFREICRREHVSKSQIINHTIKKIVEAGSVGSVFEVQNGN